MMRLVQESDDDESIAARLGLVNAGQVRWMRNFLSEGASS